MPSFVRSFFAVLLFASSLAAAEQPWNAAPLSADPKAMLAAAESVPAGESSVVVLLDEHHYTFDEEGRATSETRLVYRVADESGVDDWSTVEAEWAPWYQEKPVVAARVIGKDGTVHMLDPKAVTESAARDDSPEIFSDNRVLRAPLPGMAAGVVVEQLITYRDHNPLFQTGTAGRLMFGRYVPVQQTRLVIDAPAALTLKFVNKSAPHIEPVRTEENGRQHVVFESGRIEPFGEDFEWNLPYDESNIPYVGFSTGAAWREVARRYTEIVEKQIGDVSAVQSFLHNAIGKSTDRREIIAKALAAVQKIRYAGVEVGEGSIVPRAPKDVLALKYGDCKDKATLLVAMLRAAGIPAKVALLNAGVDLDVDAELPSVSRFNHVIVRVDGATPNDEPMWVDPTDEYSPAGTLPISDQDRLALVASATTDALTRTPAADSSANMTRETRVFTLADEGKAAVEEITEAKGSHESSNRRYAATTDKKSYRESMETYAKDTYAAESLASVDHTDPRDLSTPFRITIQVAGAARGQTGDIDSAVAIFPANLITSVPWALRTMPDEKDEKKPKKARVHDFVTPSPYVKELDYRIVPPPGFVARTLPPSENKQLGAASLSTKYEVAADGAVLATLRFDSGKRRLTPAEMEETRKALSALSESNAVIIGFDSVGWTKLNAGDIGGAIAEFRRLSAIHPKEARHHVQVGRAYFVGGMGETAREEFKRAIALDASYAPAHRFLGMALQHDLLAREFRKGFDLPAAIAEYRKAKELDTKDVEIRGELAKLLSRGTDGDLYTDGAHLAEAIDEYKAIATELDDFRYEGELLTAMAYAGRFDEMKKRAREVKDDDQRMTALVIATAATDGVDAALREAASVDNNARRRILGAAFPVVLRLRLYPQAATILDQATQGAPNATQVRSLIDVLRRTKRYEDMQFGDDPKGVAMRLSYRGATSADPDTDLHGELATWTRAFEDKLAADAKKRGDESEEDGLSALRTRAKQQSNGLPLRVAAEIGLASMEYSMDGSEATGYRVRARSKMTMPGAQQQIAETLYIVRENGRYALAAATYASVAVTVLHFVEVNDLESARQWLNWVREEITAGGGEDDPLTGPPFASLWAKAKTTATADEIRAAAATLLLTDDDYTPAAAPLLEAARATVPEALRVRIDLALANAYAQTEEPEKLVEVARRVAAAYPDSPTAFTLLTGALTENNHADEAKKLADARLAKLPNDADSLRALSRAALRSGDFETADKYGRQLIERSIATAGDYNNLAWNALFTGKELDRAIEDANQAVSLSGHWAMVHTLAALYAEAGNSIEARTKLLECMDLAGREEPSSVDWYILGRIAENYGATDAALAAYKRVTKPKRQAVDSTWTLAQRRVAGLAKK